jgi:hypothetical protein
MKNSTKIIVPRKYIHMIDEIFKDSDGYWAYSSKGYQFDDMFCHTAHEDTQNELLKVIRSLNKCDCNQCK